VDGIYYCPHHPTAGNPPYSVVCECRKPGTGLIDRAARDLDIDVQASYVVGDKWSDVELGQRTGAHTILVSTGFATDDAGNVRLPHVAEPDFVAHDIREAADWIIQQTISGTK
jgi:D-glycero-D-manno-heptose 1,7-bisphosphate phosphatase